MSLQNTCMTQTDSDLPLKFNPLEILVHWEILLGITFFGFFVYYMPKFTFSSLTVATVHNGDSSTFKSCVVQVTGNSYPIGDLPPGASTTVNVNPTGESHIVVEYTDGKGVKRRVPVDCYMDVGIGMKIEFKIASETATILKQDFTNGWD